MATRITRVVHLTACDYGSIYQRPQALSTAFAELGLESVYVTSPPLVRAYRFWKSPPLPQHLRLHRLWTMTHSALRRRVHLAKRLDEFVQQLLARSFFKPDTLVIASSPGWHHVLAGKRDKCAAIVYDCYDDLGLLVPDSPLDLDGMERQLVQDASVATVTTPALEQKLRAARGDLPILILPNAVEFARFRAAAGTGTALRQRMSIRGPTVGFLGAIYDWMDEALLVDLATRMPDVTIMLCGPVAGFDDTRLRAMPNVVFTGMVPYDQVPSHIDAFDVAIVPFRRIERMNSVNSNKFYQYLSLGKPIVTVDIPSVHEFGDLMAIARDSEDFCAKVRLALAPEQQSPDRQRERIACAQRNSWTERARQMLDFAGLTPDQRAKASTEGLQKNG